MKRKQMEGLPSSGFINGRDDRTRGVTFRDEVRERTERSWQALVVFDDRSILLPIVKLHSIW